MKALTTKYTKHTKGHFTVVFCAESSFVYFVWFVVDECSHERTKVHGVGVGAGGWKVHPLAPFLRSRARDLMLLL